MLIAKLGPYQHHLGISREKYQQQIEDQNLQLNLQVQKAKERWQISDEIDWVIHYKVAIWEDPNLLNPFEGIEGWDLDIE